MVPLLLDNLITVLMVILAIQSTHLRQMASSVPFTGQAVQLPGSRNLFRGRGRFGRFGGLEFLLGRPLLTFPCRNLFPVFQVPPVLSLFHLLRIFVGHSRTQLTPVLEDGLYLRFPPPITELDPGSEET